ncbi:MAG: hypothetical protein R3F04_10980 [Lysobacteraceae bacterium]
MTPALLDWPAPLWSAIDVGLQALHFPGGIRVAVYGALSGWLCMAFYRRFSKQSELSALGAQTAALRRELSGYDGPFDGLMVRVRQLLRLSGRHLRLSFVPALLAGLPLLWVMPWLSNQFGAQWPQPGTRVELRPEAMTVAAGGLSWSGGEVSWDAESSVWLVDWPRAGAEPISLRQGERTLLQLPMPAPSSVVHIREPLLNRLIGNPAGYLPDDAPLSAVHINLPEQTLLPFGPGWLRGWLATYLAAVFAVSLWLKWRWKLQ